MSGKFLTLVDMLRTQASRRPEVAYIHLLDGEDEELRVTFGEMDRRARAIAAALQDRGLAGQRALLLFPPNERYIDAFFGCLYAGVVPVPAYPPDPMRLERSLPRLFAIFEDAQAATILTSSDLIDLAHGVAAGSPGLEGVAWIPTDTIEDALADAWKPPGVRGSDLAFLQYTSGSTSAPRGVRLTHANLIANLECITDAFAIDADTVGATWLPPYHDMGLIGGLLAPLYNGIPTACMSPIAFLQRPVRWLRAITKYRATISGGPNFAYELAVRKLTPEDAADLDLTSWRLAFCGAEPVRAETMSRFAKCFAERGFRSSALYPCYGLAESTLLVSGGPVGRGATFQWIDERRLADNEIVATAPGSPGSRALVSSGRVLPQYELTIVNPATRVRCGDDVVGEIWLHGASVAEGYWKESPAERDPFGATLVPDDGRRYLRTGDLGFVRDGELFPTGRVKDLVIVRGRNYYPQDIEATVEASHGAIRRGCCAVVADTSGPDERLVVFAEVERRHHERRKAGPSEPPRERRGPDRRSSVPEPTFVVQPTAFVPEAIAEAIRVAVTEHHGVTPSVIVLLRAGAVRKTSSGKIQRSETLRAYLSGDLGVLSEAGPNSGPRLTSFEEVEEALSQRSPNSGETILSLVLRALRSMVGSTPIDVDAPLSRLGLDSMQSTQLAQALQAAAGVHVPHTAFLRDTTVRQVAAAITGRAYGHLPPVPTDEPARDGTIPLTVAQQALVQLQLADPQRTDYNVAFAFDIESRRPDLHEVVVQSLERLARRHALLRSRLVDGGAARLRCDVQLRPAIVDAAAMSREELRRAALDVALRPFDLFAEPLVRFSCLAVSQDHVVVVVVAHHLVVDLWSLVVVLREFSAALAGDDNSRGAGPTGYELFVRWQERYLATEAATRSISHWKQVFAEVPPSLDLGPGDADAGTGVAALSLSIDATSSVRKIARVLGATPVVVLLAAYAAAVAAVSGSDEVVIGLPVANRPLVEFADVVGYCANVVPIRLSCPPGLSFGELVQAARTAVLDALEHQFVPLPVIVRELRGMGTQPLVQAVLSVETPHLHGERDLVEVVLGVTDVQATLGNTRFRSLPLGVAPTPFELVLTLVDGAAQMTGTLGHSRRHVSDGKAAAVDVLFRRVLERGTGRPADSLSALREAPDAAALELPTDAVDVPSAILQTARTCPDAVAIRQGDVALTYGALVARARLFAGALDAMNARAGDLVAIALPPGPEVVCAQLATWLVGCAYVSLDAKLPPARTLSIVELSGARLVIAGHPLAAELGVDSVPVVTPAMLQESSSRAPLTAWRRPPPGATAYVIFTSGSTGEPKGVQVPHRGLANLASWHRDAYCRRQGVVCSSIASASFDASVWEIWGALYACGSVVFPPEDFIAAPASVRLLWDQQGVEVAFAATPLAEVLFDDAPVPSLQTLLTGGDALRRWPAADHPRVVNHYGPTEVSVVTTAWNLGNGALRRALPPIGTAVTGLETFVQDSHARRCSPFVPGELTVGGLGLASGYLKDPASTATSWCPHPTRAGARVYRTGDIVATDAEGVIWFRGRRDLQVKVLGHRIEIAEVESAIKRCEGVAQVAVIPVPRAAGGQALVAFVTPEHLDESAIRSELSARVPSYMVPARVVARSELPHTRAGKIDRRGLLTEAEEASRADTTREKPRSSLEAIVAMVWAEILGHDEVGVTDDFFHLGGHSLAIGRVASRLGELLDVDIPLRGVVRSTTVRDLAIALTTSFGDELEDRAEIALQVLTMSDDEAAAMVGQAAEG